MNTVFTMVAADANTIPAEGAAESDNNNDQSFKD
jgi:hypothetical protein